jgi:hypothetical protein
VSRGVLIVGRGRVAEALYAGLQRSGHQAHRARDHRVSPRLLGRARSLVLAIEEDSGAPPADALAGLLARRPAAMAQLRVLVAAAVGSPVALPELPQGAGVTLETLDLARAFARDLLARRPVHAAMDPPFAQVPHLLFAGDAPPAQALAVQAMRVAHYGASPPVFSFASDDPQAQREALAGAYPQAERLCRLRFTRIDPPDLGAQPPVTAVYVCLDPAEAGLDTARRLMRLIRLRQGVSPPVYLEVGDAEPGGDLAEWDGQLFPFSWLREACQARVWLDSRGDELAQVVHEHYRDSIAAQGRDPAGEQAGLPWGELTESYRDANRHQADHLWAKLAVTDCRAVPEEQVDSFAFAPLEVEHLAVVEHARWAADRYLQGWSFAPRRDNQRKYHPQLVPYADLSEPMKDLDRFAVRLVPLLLARSGRGLERMLIVGVPAEESNGPADPALEGVAGLALQRLVRRYPDRSLVLASTLARPSSRVIVRLAMERFAAGLFLICERPISDTLAAQPSPPARRDLLELAARAERRVCLGPPRTAADWFARRAEILLLGDPAFPRERPAKRVVLATASGDPAWSFEY